MSSVVLISDLEKSSGNYFTDVDGNTYLDAFRQIASLPLGYNNEALQKVLTDPKNVAALTNRTAMVEERTLDLEVIVNPKTLDGGVNVIQLETAVGAAMKCFEKCRGINVPRSRFLPVKKTSDLLLIMSNLYTLTNGSLTMSPERMFQTTPLIKLGDESFKKVND